MDVPTAFLVLEVDCLLRAVLDTGHATLAMVMELWLTILQCDVFRQADRYTYATGNAVIVHIEVLIKSIDDSNTLEIRPVHQAIYRKYVVELFIDNLGNDGLNFPV